MKIVSIVGARPQFIKLAPCSQAIRSHPLLEEVVVHTGQHDDYQMSQAFFQEFQLPEPSHHLEFPPGKAVGPYGRRGHGELTGRILIWLEEVLLREAPDAVLVFGDTDSTLAGALAAAKLHIPVAHVEAGLRSFDRRMPEEVNRVLTDHVSSLLFAPTPQAVENLCREGITEGVHLVGDVMKDLLLQWGARSGDAAPVLRKYRAESGRYLLLTIHREENTENPEFVRGVIEALDEQDLPVLFPVHPRTRKLLEASGERSGPPEAGSLSSPWRDASLPGSRVLMTAPLPYGDTLRLVKHARKVLTDSGGLQKEAVLLGTPCLTLRETTEWVETLEGGWNRLVGGDPERIRAGLAAPFPTAGIPDLYGRGRAAEAIADLLARALSSSGLAPRRSPL